MQNKPTLESDIAMVRVPELAIIAAERYADIAENYREGCGCAVNCFDARSLIRKAQTSAAHYIKIADVVAPAYQHIRSMHFLETYRVNDKFVVIRTAHDRWELGEIEDRQVKAWGFHGTAEEVSLRAFRD